MCKGVKQPKVTCHGCGVCLQRAAYSEVSIRELLKWVKRLGCYIQEHKSQQQPQGPHYQLVPNQVLSDLAFMIYAARFRTAKALDLVGRAISEQSWPDPMQLGEGQHGAAAAAAAEARQLMLTAPTLAAGHTAKEFNAATFDDAASSHNAYDGLIDAAHAAVVHALREPSFWQEHGLYMVPHSWRHHWQQQSHGLQAPSTQKVGWMGVYLYSIALTGAAAASKAAAAIATYFGLSSDIVAAAESADSLTEAFKVLCSPAPLVQHLAPLAPYVVGQRVLKVWHVAASALKAGEPVLVIGKEGCGKSSCLAALAWLLGKDLQAAALTPGG
jgi:hypothetical protein